MMRCEDCTARHATLYAGADSGELAAISAARLDVVGMPGGRMIIENESESRFVYMLKAGRAYRFLLRGNGRRQILEHFREGDLLTPGVMFGARTPGVVRALGEVLLCRFDRGKLLDIIESSPGLRQALFERCARQKEMCDRHRMQLGAMTAEEAVAALILQFAEPGRERSGVVLFPLRLGHVADTLGMTEIHAGRVLRSLEKAGAIRREGGRRLWLDRGRLEAILDDKVVGGGG